MEVVIELSSTLRALYTPTAHQVLPYAMLVWMSIIGLWRQEYRYRFIELIISWCVALSLLASVSGGIPGLVRTTEEWSNSYNRYILLKSPTTSFALPK